MRRLALLLALIVCCTPVVMAQVGPVVAGVYGWGMPQPILEGHTTALSHLTLRAVALAPGQAVHYTAADSPDERLLIVKEGAVRITLGDDGSAAKTVGPGSVALVMPGTACRVENTDETSAAYYAFRYRSKAHPDAARGQAAGGSLLVDWDDLAVKQTEKGARRQQFDRATAMFERFEMHTTTLNEGLRSHAPHTHPAEEFILIIEGDVEEQIGEAFHRAAPGDIIFLPSESLHTIANVGQGPATYFAFQWE